MSIGGLGSTGGEVGPDHTRLTAGFARSSAADAGVEQDSAPVEAVRAPFFRRSAIDTASIGTRSTTFAGFTRPVVQPPHCRPHSSVIGPRGCTTRRLAEQKSAIRRLSQQLSRGTDRLQKRRTRLASGWQRQRAELGERERGPPLAAGRGVDHRFGHALGAPAITRSRGCSPRQLRLPPTLRGRGCNPATQVWRVVRVCVGAQRHEQRQ